MNFLQLLCISFLQNIKYRRIYNKLCITRNIVTYKLLCHVRIIIVRWQPKVQVMGFDPSTFFLQHRIQRYKQVNTKNLREERKILSYPSLGLADVTIRPVVAPKGFFCRFSRFCSEMALNSVDVHHSHIASQASGSLTSQAIFP
jgi:hypothetical protein